MHEILPTAMCTTGLRPGQSPKHQGCWRRSSGMPSLPRLPGDAIALARLLLLLQKLAQQFSAGLQPRPSSRQGVLARRKRRGCGLLPPLLYCRLHVLVLLPAAGEDGQGAMAIPSNKARSGKSGQLSRLVRWPALFCSGGGPLLAAPARPSWLTAPSWPSVCIFAAHARGPRATFLHAVPGAVRHARLAITSACEVGHTLRAGYAAARHTLPRLRRNMGNAGLPRMPQLLGPPPATPPFL